MPKVFNSNIGGDPNQPTIRQGDSVPDGAVGLAYSHISDLTPGESILVVDTSGAISQNSQPITVREMEMWSDPIKVGRDNTTYTLIRDNNGNTDPQTEAFIITNKYTVPEDNTEKPEPLFYVHRCRFNHYEHGMNFGDGEHIYDGDAIRILDEDLDEVGMPYQVTVDPTAKDDEYEVSIYTSFVGTEDTTYYVEYTKSSSNIEPQHREILNASLLFTRVAGTNTNSFTTVNSNEYSVEPTDSGTQWKVYVDADGSEVTAKSPYLVRYRLNDGTNQTPWLTEYILKLNQVDDIDKKPDKSSPHLRNIPIPRGDDKVYDENGRLMLTDYGEYANDYGVTVSDSSDIEIERWDGSAWGSVDPSLSDQTVQINLVNDRLYFNVIDSTIGEVRAEPEGQEDYIRLAKYYPESDETSLPTVKIEAKGKDATFNPPVYKNWAHDSTADLSEPADVYGDTTTPYYPTWSRYGSTLWKILILNGVIRPWFMIPWSWHGHRLSMYTDVATLNDIPTQAKQEQMISLSWGGATKDLNKISATVGSRGRLTKLSYVDSNDVEHEVMIDDVDKSWFYDLTESEHHFDTQVTGVKEVRAYIQPEKILVRDRWWLWNWFGHSDLYKFGYELVDIGAWQSEPMTVDVSTWSSEHEFTTSTQKNTPDVFDLYDIAEKHKLLPGFEVGAEDIVEYKVFLKPGCEPDTTMVVMDQKTGDIVVPEYSSAKGTYVFNLTYEQLTSSETDYKIVVDRNKDGLTKSVKYTLRTTDGGVISAELPEDQGVEDMWLPRISNGSFTIKEGNGQDEVVKEYRTMEFYDQPFDPGFPDMTVVDELATVIDYRCIELNNKPLRIDEAANIIPSITIEGDQVAPSEIKDWDIAKGRVYFNRDINFNDEVLVTYRYQAKNFYYRGYEDENGVFHYLDLNPQPGHMYTRWDDNVGDYIDAPTSELLDKTVYLYIKPANIYPASGRPTNNKNSIEHCFNHSDVDGLLIAKIQVRQPVSEKDVVLLDARTRGGGLDEDVPLEVAQSIDEAAEYYWDYGRWDGKPYPSNSVVVVTLPKNLLDNFSEDEIREVVEQHMAFGSYPIIRFE